MPPCRRSLGLDAVISDVEEGRRHQPGSYGIADPRPQGDQPVGPASESEPGPEGPSLATPGHHSEDGGDEHAEGQAEQRSRPELARGAERREAEPAEAD